MGYEIAGGLGVKLADQAREVIVMLGDGSYLMLNSEIATSVMLGLKLTIVVLDNRGFGCINRLQAQTGGAPFNNLLAGTAPEIDFAAHAASLGALAEKVDGIAGLEAAMGRAAAAPRTYVIVIDTDPALSTAAGGAWWDVPVPEVSDRAQMQANRAAYEVMLMARQGQTIVDFGVSPIAWANDDMPELGGDTAVETILSDAAAIGFAGIELGRRFPRDPKVLAPMLASRRLCLIGGWYSLNLLIRDAEAEIAALQPHLALLKAMESWVFIAAETSNAIHSDRARPLADTPRLAAADWPRFGERLATVADYIASEGLKFAYHFHLGTVVERQADLDVFIAATPDTVGLVVDTGHAALGGVDAAALIRRHPERIVHVHAKDVRRPVFDQIMAERRSFLDGVLAGMFTAPGDGGLDFSAVLRALSDIGYDGWIVIEAEQDPKLADPRVYSRLGLKTLRAAAKAAGLIGSLDAAE
jgi:inosose dehydratase